MYYEVEKKTKMCLLMREEKQIFPKKGGPMTSIASGVVTIQIAANSLPSVPS
jgi:hypothetical protein